MFFTFVRGFVRILLYIFNGKPTYINRDKLPKDETYVLIAPHRSLIDPVFIALAASPRQFCFMAKKELFNHKLFGWFISNLNAFPVDRDNPKPSAIKKPIKILKENKLSLVIFPTGTRHSQELKGGAVTIARMSKRPIVPVVYEGPYTIKDIFKRKKAVVKIGDPFYVERKLEGVDDINQYYSDKIQQSFEELDQISVKK
ncbi:lysophospholipid acyltransferase family protein [Marinilactibacillus piezotolerans]|uniref:lysophospholipid acyltransferase family protein n=1 Tax=Marinilactibacillus piezotolerans TaxID=258723 RepID=UPI0009AFA972|nr:1-acyl-sn-glycerol-3-phosphate acyltransferase [Marinilactibacillus piezotolerans]